MLCSACLGLTKIMCMDGKSLSMTVLVCTTSVIVLILLSSAEAFPTPRCEQLANWEGWEVAPGKLFRCPAPNLMADQFIRVICSRSNCRNPQTNAAIRGYYSKPIIRTLRLLDRNNNYKDIKISVGCYCKKRVLK
uniref:CTCK domain-containing protein n=1 Tax=Ciona savignyi TaxID=51511 RepID=H2Z6H3_CIOSA